MTVKALELINKYLPDPVEYAVDNETFFKAVRQRIKHLLDTDMERLLHTLYRIDVPESKVREVLAHENPDNIDTAITELIIQRIREKIETRKKYQ
jgi:hypothetical protein